MMPASIGSRRWTTSGSYPSVGKRDEPYFDAYTTLPAIARETNGMEVGPLVTSPHYRNSAMLGRQMTTLDHASDGRAVFGVGAGWFEEEYDAYGFEYPDPERRVHDLRDTVSLVQGGMSEEHPFDDRGWAEPRRGDGGRAVVASGLDRRPDSGRFSGTLGGSNADFDVEEVFAVLDDRDCRDFLEALDEPLTASDLSRRYDVPSSTTYRKLDRLSTVGLVDSTTDICGSNNHQARYHRTVKSVTFDFDVGEVSVEAEPPDR